MVSCLAERNSSLPVGVEVHPCREEEVLVVGVGRVLLPVEEVVLSTN